ncbi:hypothetical protein [Pseudoalteromonas sp. B62]|uniref:hypothetical protein n=1 Tax=Pseudoalteromonas sp. B62 TaxID=630483 RepID=UPI00301D928B
MTSAPCLIDKLLEDKTSPSIVPLPFRVISPVSLTVLTKDSSEIFLLPSSRVSL